MAGLLPMGIGPTPTGGSTQNPPTVPVANRFQRYISQTWQKLIAEMANGELLIAVPQRSANADNPLLASVVTYTETRVHGVWGEETQENRDGGLAAGSTDTGGIVFVAPYANLTMAFAAFDDLMRRPDVAITLAGARINCKKIEPDDDALMAVIHFTRLSSHGY